MKLPQLNTPAKYVGLYVIDFGDQCALGYTAEEVASLLESERFRQAKVYKIHRAQPDGALELHGVSRSRFDIESGMFFHCRDQAGAQVDYQRLLDWSREQSPPCRAKLQLAQGPQATFIIALVYPAEYEQEMGAWLQDSGFTGRAAVDAGPSQVTRYYDTYPDILQRRQLIPSGSLQPRDNQQLLDMINEPLQRRLA